MLNKKLIAFLTLFLNLLFAGEKIISAGNQDVSESKAVELFERGDYEKAVPLFSVLLQQNPDNPMLNYYYGAAQTETGHFSEQTLNSLLKAREGEPPAKVNYYLGQQFQAQNNWTNALKFYNLYQLNASVEQRKELKIAEKIQQCFNEVNPYTLSEPEDWQEVQEPEADITTAKDTQPTPVPKAPRQEITRLETIDDVSLFRNNKERSRSFRDYAIEFPVNSRITYYQTSHFKNEEARKLFDEAENLKNALNFSLNQMEELRKEYRSTSNPAERDSIGNKIISFENDSYGLKEEINQLLSRARNLENQYWQNASGDEVDEFIARAEKLAAKRKEKTEAPKVITEGHADTEIMIDPELLLDDSETENRFEEPEKEDELIYKIQLGAYSRQLPTYVKRTYDRLSLIRKIDKYTDEEGVVVYTTGNLQKLEDALKMRNQVRQEGVEDAFVVPYFKGKRITLEEAKKLETGS
ncbi:MAG: hypothetical protein ACOC1D_01005 [Prolixibacteraceae bacterium]